MKSSLPLNEDSVFGTENSGIDMNSLTRVSSLGDRDARLRLKGNITNKSHGQLCWTATTPMETSDEEKSYHSGIPTHTTNRNSVGDIAFSNTKLNQLMKEFKNASGKIRQLEKENIFLKNKLRGFAQTYVTGDVKIKWKMESLEELVEEKNREIKELLNFIVILEDVNVKLHKQSDRWELNDKKLRKKIRYLNLSISNKNPKLNVFLSCNTVDWKQKIERDQVARRSRDRAHCGIAGASLKETSKERFKRRAHTGVSKSSDFGQRQWNRTRDKMTKPLSEKNHSTTVVSERDVSCAKNVVDCEEEFAPSLRTVNMNKQGCTSGALVNNVCNWIDDNETSWGSVF